MGLLDDAIREHLDLKRRRGADPIELDRAEREALGPVRRKGDVAATGYADDDADEALDLEHEASAVEPGPAAYDQAEDAWGYGDAEPVADEPEAGPPTRSRRAAADDEGDADEDQPRESRGLAARFGLRGRRAEQDEVEPEDQESPPSEDEVTRVHRASGSAADRDRTPDPTGGETAEHEVAGAHGDDAGDDEDMLEETPEFLQDAPDHDRLWFEQRPPRDFDFDG